MLLNLEELTARYNMWIDGIIHIGAHHGEEYVAYATLGIFDVIFFEPDKAAFEVLKKNVGQEAICINKALGSVTSKQKYWLASNDGASTSLLRPKQHLQHHPDVHFQESADEFEIIRLDDFWLNSVVNRLDYNMINMDIQGYELEALKGAEKTLLGIDYILTEVNRAEVYEGCAQVEQLDEFLAKYGFDREETNWAGGTWGDALYVKT